MNLDEFYKKNGYYPGLNPGESEHESGIQSWELRQCVAVTLAAAFDQWFLVLNLYSEMLLFRCLSQIALKLDRNEDHNFFLKKVFFIFLL
jgi:hypothetical protein